MIKNCLYCGKEFNVRPFEYDRRKCCSRECIGKYQLSKVNVKCKWCGKDLIVIKSKKDKNNFCDINCLGKWNSKRRNNKVSKICSVCGKEFLVAKGRENTAVTCSVKCQNEWQRINRTGINSPNWISDGGDLTCEWCGKTYHVNHSIYNHRGSRFCSRKCKQKHWSKNIRTSDDFKNKQKIANSKQWKSKSFREKIRITALNTLHSFKDKRETSIEKKIRQYLETNNVKFEAQYIINNKFCVDFIIPDKNIIIEAFGDYYHSNPLFYGDGKRKLNNMQISNKNRDKSRVAYLNKCGYKLWIIWERDINSKLEIIMKNILK